MDFIAELLGKIDWAEFLLKLDWNLIVWFLIKLFF